MEDSMKYLSYIIIAIVLIIAFYFIYKYLSKQYTVIV